MLSSPRHQNKLRRAPERLAGRRRATVQECLPADKHGRPTWPACGTPAAVECSCAKGNVVTRRSNVPRKGAILFTDFMMTLPIPFQAAHDPLLPVIVDCAVSSAAICFECVHYSPLRRGRPNPWSWLPRRLTSSNSSTSCPSNAAISVSSFASSVSRSARAGPVAG